MSRRRTVLAWLAGLLLFVLLARPSLWAELYCRRELLRLGEIAGIMYFKDPGNYGGQILGYNYLRDPVWYHWLAGGLSAAIGYAPAFIASVLLARRLSGASTVTRCGGCGAPLLGLTQPACPSCGRKF